MTRVVALCYPRWLAAAHRDNAWAHLVAVVLCTGWVVLPIWAVASGRLLSRLGRPFGARRFGGACLVCFSGAKRVCLSCVGRYRPLRVGFGVELTRGWGAWVALTRGSAVRARRPRCGGAGRVWAPYALWLWASFLRSARGFWSFEDWFGSGAFVAASRARDWRGRARRRCLFARPFGGLRRMLPAPCGCVGPHGEEGLTREVLMKHEFGLSQSEGALVFDCPNRVWRGRESCPSPRRG